MSTTANRILYHDRFDGKGFTDDNSLSNALLTKPDQISAVITYLAGREENRFPLTFMTEGQVGGMKSTKEINDIQYEWSTFKRLRKGSKVKSSAYSSGDKPGINGSEAIAMFDDKWLIEQHTVVAPDGTMCRVVQAPLDLGAAGFEYRFTLLAAQPGEFIHPSNFAAGTVWVMEGGAAVSTSLSMGNSSNIVTPGKMKNQITTLRKSYHLAGNVANKTVECKFRVGGAETSLWIDFERWQHQMNWRFDCEEHYWWSKYNRLANGVITDKDKQTGLPIPIGAGVMDQIPNNDTYSILTAKKIRNTVLDVTYGAPDAPMDIVLYTGKGGAEEFHNAMLEEATRFTQIIGDKFTRGVGNNLELGGYYNKYITPQGHLITVKLCSVFDNGSRAQNSPKHPITGLPLTSYEMVFIDQTTYDGEKNLVMISQKGRSFIEGIEKGMAAIYTLNGMAAPNNNYVSTEQDKSSVHYMAVKGVCIRRNTHCFRLSCDLS